MTNPFTKARMTLTLWYVIILIIVSAIFSTVVYTSLNAELLRSARREQQKIIAEKLQIVLPKPLPDPKDLKPELVDPPLNNEIKAIYINSRNQLLFSLLLANMLVMGLSGIASYLLAGITLRPIEIMLEDQKAFIANASHELRTPLTMLKTAIEVTLKMGPIPYTQMKNLLESNLDDVHNLEVLANKLLVIEKYSGLSKKTSFSHVQLDDLVKDCVKRVSQKTNTHHIQITIKTIPIAIVGDESGLREVVTNILDNALKYNKPHGKIDVLLSHKNGKIYLAIKDAGIGIQKSDIPHVFERFFRGDTSRSKTKIHGYGLGLSIASQIIHRHSGNISVESEIGKGTTFTVELPDTQG